MNLTIDIIFRLIIVVVLTAIIMKVLWSILKNYLDGLAIGRQEKSDLNSLIEQQKRLMRMNQVGSDEEARKLLSNLQWGDKETIELIRNHGKFEATDDEISRALFPIKQNYSKLAQHSYQQCLNMCLIAVHHALNNNSAEDVFSLALENADVCIEQYLDKSHCKSDID